MKRSLASSMGYGVGQATEEISMTGDEITVTGSGQASQTNTMIVGGGEQNMDTSGGSVRITPVWANGAISVTTSNGLTITRSMRGNQMVVERTKNGVAVTQEFTKQ